MIRLNSDTSKPPPNKRDSAALIMYLIPTVEMNAFIYFFYLVS